MINTKFKLVVISMREEGSVIKKSRGFKVIGNILFLNLGGKYTGV